VERTVSLVVLVVVLAAVATQPFVLVVLAYRVRVLLAVTVAEIGLVVVVVAHLRWEQVRPAILQ
jgi:hypothetical protein